MRKKAIEVYRLLNELAPSGQHPLLQILKQAIVRSVGADPEPDDLIVL